MLTSDTKRLAYTVLACVIVLFTVWGISRLIRASHRPEKASTLHTINYTRMICDNAYQTDVRHEKDTPYIDIHLSQGCFSGFVALPDAWTNWQEQFRGNDGSDWMAEWYEGWINPRGPFSQAQVNAEQMPGYQVTKKLVRFEGKGTLRIYRLTENPTAASSSSMAPKDADIIPAKLIEPTSGQDKDVLMELAGCAHDGNTIQCTGYLTNATDAPNDVSLRDSSAVDDEGNSFDVYVFGGGLRYSQGDADERILPTVKTKFIATIADAHQNVKSVSLRLSMSCSDPYRYVHPVFTNIPVQ